MQKVKNRRRILAQICCGEGGSNTAQRVEERGQRSKEDQEKRSEKAERGGEEGGMRKRMGKRQEQGRKEAQMGYTIL